jgi:Flp pilus assembly protein TadG
MTEFALIVPVLILMLFAVIDLGRYVYTQNALNQVSREAARVGAVRSRPACDAPTRDACVREVVAERIAGVVGAVTFDEDGAGGATDDYGCYETRDNGPLTKRASVDVCKTRDLLKVKVRNSFTLFTPVIAQLVGGLQVTGVAQVTVN